MARSSHIDIGKLADLSIHVRITMYIAHMGLVRIDHIENKISADRMKKHWCNLNDELCSAWGLYFLTHS